MLKYCIIVLLFANSSLRGQNDCTFKIDTQRIFLNQNLDTFIHELELDTFHIIPDKRLIPPNVLNQLQCLAEGFGLANPKENFRCCCTSSPSLPQRQLIQLFISKELLVITYRHGEGIVCNSRILIIKFNNSGILDLWTNFYGGSKLTKQQIINYLIENKSKFRNTKTDLLNF